MRVFCRKKSQSLMEYSVLLVIVVVALAGMFTYMKRGIQMAVKTSSDQLGSQSSISIRTQKVSDTVTTTRSLNSVVGQIQNFLGGVQRRLINSANAIYRTSRSQVIEDDLKR